MSNYPYSLRYIARIIIEADTPLSVGSGENDMITDSPVCVDCNFLPMIQGTTLAGVLRHQLQESLSKETIDSVFGFQEKGKGEGSRLIVSSAHILGEDGNVLEGLVNPNTIENSPYLRELKQLPVRDHCRIDHKGVATSQGKFDNQVVFKGVRFVFEMELIGKKEDSFAWEKVLQSIKSPLFRIGSGTRKGFGKLKIIELYSQQYDLTKPQDLEKYLNKSSSLNSPLSNAQPKEEGKKEGFFEGWIKYQLCLSPESTWMFGSGLSDEEADMIPIYEKTVEWKENNQPYFTARKILVPATSVKGAISHRVAFHYNRLNNIHCDKVRDISQHVGENNPAVKALFGCAKDSNTNKGQIGNVILSDIFIKDQNKTKIFNHVTIDRFTGGAMDSALFDEKVLMQRSFIQWELFVKKSVFEKDETIQKAWEKTLDDIKTGMLCLGGSVMRGHGIFQGDWKEEGQNNG